MGHVSQPLVCPGTFFTIVCAEILSLGVIGLMNVPFGMLITLIPILVFIFTLSASIHVLNHLHLLIFHEKDAIDSKTMNSLLNKVYKEKRSALYYSLLTTAVGFLSLSLSSINPIKNLGIYTAVSCGIVIVSVTILLKFLLGFYQWKNKKRSFLFFQLLEGILLRTFSFFLGRRHILLILSAVLIGYGFTLIRQLPVDTNALNYFQDTEKLKKDIFWVEENLTGMSSVNILFEKATPKKKLNVFFDTLE